MGILGKIFGYDDVGNDNEEQDERPDYMNDEEARRHNEGSNCNYGADGWD